MPPVLCYPHDYRAKNNTSARCELAPSFQMSCDGNFNANTVTHFIPPREEGGAAERYYLPLTGGHRAATNEWCLGNTTSQQKSSAGKDWGLLTYVAPKDREML